MSLCKQVLVYFAVAKKGDLPTDGKTEVNPEGLTAAFGMHAQVFADRLAEQNLSCKVSHSKAHVVLAACLAPNICVVCIASLSLSTHTSRKRAHSMHSSIEAYHHAFLEPQLENLKAWNCKQVLGKPDFQKSMLEKLIWIWLAPSADPKHPLGRT